MPIERGRLEHRRRQLALDVAAGRIGERAFLTAVRRVTEEEARVEDGGPARQGVDAARAIDYIRNFASSWAKAKPPTKAMMVQSLYEEIVVRGGECVSVRLTPEAYAHGLALALPQEVLVPAMRTKGRPRKMWALARPTGDTRARTHSAFRVIPIEEAEAWKAGVESSA